MKGSVEERFWAKVDKSGDCWLWTASLCNGYGELRVRRGDKFKKAYAHRLSWELANGPIPPGMEVDHRTTCPKSCVNPGHLRLATRKQNQENRSGAQRNSTSGVRGVAWDKSRGVWRGHLTHERKMVHVGYFNSLEDAEMAVKAARQRIFTHADNHGVEVPA